jgi:hypothetical protein
MKQNIRTVDINVRKSMYFSRADGRVWIFRDDGKMTYYDFGTGDNRYLRALKLQAALYFKKEK